MKGDIYWYGRWYGYAAPDPQPRLDPPDDREHREDCLKVTKGGFCNCSKLDALDKFDAAEAKADARRKYGE